MIVPFQLHSRLEHRTQGVHDTSRPGFEHYLFSLYNIFSCISPRPSWRLLVFQSNPLCVPRVLLLVPLLSQGTPFYMSCVSVFCSHYSWDTRSWWKRWRGKIQRGRENEKCVSWMDALEIFHLVLDVNRILLSFQTAGPEFEYWWWQNFRHLAWMWRLTQTQTALENTAQLTSLTFFYEMKFWISNPTSFNQVNFI